MVSGSSGQSLKTTSPSPSLSGATILLRASASREKGPGQMTPTPGTRAPSPAIVGATSGFVLSCVISLLFIIGLNHRGLMIPRSPEAAILRAESESQQSVPSDPCASDEAKTTPQCRERSKNQQGNSPDDPTAEDEPDRDYLVPISILEEVPGSLPQAGVCLDGSPPAYHMRAGWGSGARKWVVYLEGGGWCTGPRDCEERSRTRLGSSLHMQREVAFGGILSNSSRQNPFFFNWNAVFVRYCDGASFAGMGKQGVHGRHEGGVTVAGQRVFDRVMQKLMEGHGMRHASHALLSGCSAGGLAALLHCDQFRDILEGSHFSTAAGARRRRLQANGEGPRRIGGASSDEGSPSAGSQGPLGPSDAREGSTGAPVVKCLSDAGFFPDVEDVTGKRTLFSVYSRVVEFHRPLLDSSCMHRSPSDMPEADPTCFFAENFLPFTATPYFLLSPLYDLWLIRNAFVPESGLQEEWAQCRKDLGRCSSRQVARLHSYRAELLERTKKVLQETEDAAPGNKAASANGAFLDSCRTHCQAMHSMRWHSATAPRVGNRTMAQAVAAWFLGEDGENVHVDCEYPCNPTCFPHTLGY